MVTRRPPFLLLFLALAAMAFGRPAQLPSPADASNNPQRQLERSYELVAKQALLRYYSENTFLVRAKVELFEEEDDGFVDNQTAHPMPALPGLPVQPSNRGGSGPASVMDRLAAVSYDILVDTSYNIRDRDFIVYLVGLAATLDTARGDLVAVERVVFPRSDKSLASPRKFDNFAPLGGMAGAQLVPAIPDTGMKNAMAFGAAPVEKSKDPMERIYDLLPLLIVCIFVLLCVWLLSRAIASPTALRERMPFLRGKGSKGDEEDASAGATPAPTTTIALSPTTTVPAAAPTQEANAANDAQSIRPYLLNSFVGEPRICGLILKSWLKRDSIKGWRDVGTLVAGLHPRLLQIVQDSLGKENARALEIQLASREDHSPEEFLIVAKEFRREFQTASSTVATDGRDADLFGFLEQLNEGQIMHILRDESMGIVGFALAQLSSEKAGSILQKLDGSNRAKLLVSMGNITQIPHDVYKEIADRLSLKALEVANMKFVSADGVESIVALIDNLPVTQQFEYIHSISEMDLNLARKIRERTITLPELGGLPDAYLADKLQAMDGETLSLAFLRMDAQLCTKLMAQLPDRMQMMVQSGMESRAQATALEVEAAQRKILQVIREDFRKNGRPS
ncbi:MAG: hypothetical protein RL318_2321 [Fibrobacterota bacterium]|jgi:hypothetical protein